MMLKKTGEIICDTQLFPYPQHKTLPFLTQSYIFAQIMAGKNTVMEAT